MRTLLKLFLHVLFFFSLQLTYAADLPQIDWGNLTDKFEILSGPRLGTQEVQSWPSGRVGQFKGVEFDVKAKMNLQEADEEGNRNWRYNAVSEKVRATFYDTADIEMGIQFVILTPKYYRVGWKQGMVGTGFIPLPEGIETLKNVKVIKLEGGLGVDYKPR
jgi:hypothetical protein